MNTNGNHTRDYLLFKHLAVSFSYIDDK